MPGRTSYTAHGHMIPLIVCSFITWTYVWRFYMDSIEIDITVYNKVHLKRGTL